ncbi:TetR/AcrR family transcriptional regulator, partial [Streptomyces sp. NPDC020412]|uniref:TetR/AcrR family transcriptional regulator n=1 Tax=Streptomyces sp. NPDC020412 TaxID=3365073 RepID=UPI0037981CE3
MSPNSSLRECRLADERGLEGVTLRDVAARAQVSMGAVQRCFSTKDEMLAFTLDHVGERIGERVRARVVRAPAQSAASALGHAATEVSLLVLQSGFAILLVDSAGNAYGHRVIIGGCVDS